MKPRKEKPCCTECGLCCITLEDDEVYCDLDRADIQRIPEKLKKHVRNVTATHGTPALETKCKRVKAGVLKNCKVCACALLDGDPLKKCSCKIYENRPAVCRTAIKPGDRTCCNLIKLFEDFIEETSRMSDSEKKNAAVTFYKQSIA